MHDDDVAGQLRPDDAGQHERPRPGHPADAPARSPGCRRPDAPSSSAELLAPHFEVETVGTGEQAARDAWELIEADGSQDAAGLRHRGRRRLADGPASGARRDGRSWRPTHSAGVARPGASAILHVLVLDKLLAPALGAKPTCQYVHLLSEVTDATAARQCQLAVLVPPATMGHVEEIAGNLEKMPPKSTYFYPKLLSGLVFNSLKTS